MGTVMKAITYSRWSKHEQSTSTTVVRQQEICDGFAKRESLRVVERVIEDGISAWTGDNIIIGELAKLIDRVERSGGDDTVLIVEKLDRLSRRDPLEMANWIQRVVATGLIIATGDGRHWIDRDFTKNQMVFLGLCFEAFRGFEESQTKSDRVGEAWRIKRDLGAPMTRLCPGWLTIDAGATNYRNHSTSGYRVIEERADIVRRIFEMTAKGTGAASIAAMFNREGVEVFGRGKGWYASYVRKILNNPAVIGEYQPHVAPRGGKRTPTGDIIRDYFPPIISTELFERVNDRRARRVIAKQSPNRLVNLFGGLARCSHCDGAMTMVAKGSETLAGGSKVDRRYLKCSNAHRSHGCDNRTTFEYGTVERAILDHLLPLAMDDQHFRDDCELGAIERDLVEAKRNFEHAKRRQLVAYTAHEDDPDDDLAARRYRERRDEVKALKSRVTQLEEASANLGTALTPQEHVKRVAEVRDLMDHPHEPTRYEARLRVKLAINDLFDHVVFSGRKNRFWVGIGSATRTVAFDRRDGSIGFDLDWSDKRPDWVDANDPVMADYLRRKAAS
jgi:DNA invertase Pin-like site-specific DNA recombinase